MFPVRIQFELSNSSELVVPVFSDLHLGHNESATHPRDKGPSLRYHEAHVQFLGMEKS